MAYPTFRTLLRGGSIPAKLSPVEAVVRVPDDPTEDRGGGPRPGAGSL
ncbi:hypothetical protein [Actinoallomurus bryophytorum]|nr:hypothetical protein [Actinoallomurus bryophytorum]